jgi:8-oxo-dGTP diphosphatase
MRREYPERPWIGVGVVVWQGDRVLLVRRGRPPRQGQWGLPGGTQEVGETVFEAAAREVREETGLEVRPVAIITTVDSITRDADGAVQYHYTLVEVAADCAAGDPVAADDAADARWATLEEAEGLVEWDETRRILGLSAAQRQRILAEPPPAR